MSKITKAKLFKRAAECVSWSDPTMLQAARVVAHAEYQKRRGRNPSMAFIGIKNPRTALESARECECPWDTFLWNMKKSRNDRRRLKSIRNEILTA